VNPVVEASLSGNLPKPGQNSPVRAAAQRSPPALANDPGWWREAVTAV